MDNNDLLYRTAIHESGHALAHYLTSGNIRDIEYIEIYKKKCTIDGLCEVTNEAGNSTAIKYNEEGGHKYWFDIFCQQVAGVCAESIIFKEPINNGYLEGDLHVFHKNTYLCQHCGLFDTDGNRNEVFANLEKDAIRYITDKFSENANIEILKKIAQSLVAQDTIHHCKRMLSKDILPIIENKPEN